MNCEFCRQPLRFSHHENDKEVDVYDCTHCPVLVSFYCMHESSKSHKITFLIDRNGKSYMWTNNYLNNNSHITDLGVNVAREGKDPMILKFPKIMNVNPTNIYEKFAFYMVFL